MVNIYSICLEEPIPLLNGYTSDVSDYNIITKYHGRKWVWSNHHNYEYMMRWTPGQYKDSHNQYMCSDNFTKIFQLIHKAQELEGINVTKIEYELCLSKAINDSHISENNA